MIIILILILFISITFHEYAHGWVAHKLGDPTPKQSGRLTLNPIAHIDPFGTIALPILLLIASGGAFAIGYAKPMPINPYHFKNPKKDLKLVGAAGPSANIILAILLTLIYKIGIPMFAQALILGVAINLMLAIFNLVPIPPLDGSRIVASLLPTQLAYKYLKIEPYGFLIIFLLFVLGFFRWFIFPLVNIIFRYLLGIDLGI